MGERIALVLAIGFTLAALYGAWLRWKRPIEEDEE